MSVDLQMEGKGGHSSLPPQDGSQVWIRCTEILGMCSRSGAGNCSITVVSPDVGNTALHRTTTCCRAGEQAVSRLAKLLAAIDARPPPAKLGSPTLELLQGLGAASQNRLLRWVLSRSAHWCMLTFCRSDSTH